MGFEFRKNEKNGQKNAIITGYDGNVKYLNIPSSIEGLPVTDIDDHAFSGRSDISEAMIPESVRSLGRFCFYDCRNLEKISLHDSVRDYYDGAIRECRALNEIDVRITEGAYRVVKDMADDVREKMHFRLEICRPGEDAVGPDVVRLTIPAYHDEDREDTMARAIHPKIVGAGYAYRQTITRTGIRYREYDSLFGKACTDGPEQAGDIALDRLGFPYMLSGECRQEYVSYLNSCAGEVLEALVNGRETDRIRCFLENADAGKAAIDFAVDRASDVNYTEAVGMLMEYRGRHFPPAPESFFL